MKVWYWNIGRYLHSSQRSQASPSSFYQEPPPIYIVFAQTYSQGYLFSILALNIHHHPDHLPPATSPTSSWILCLFTLFSHLPVALSNPPLFYSPPSRRLLPPPSNWLITWDPAPQAQPHVAMETVPHASAGLTDAVEAGDVELQWFRVYILARKGSFQEKCSRSE